jgi:hypothetical protein
MYYFPSLYQWLIKQLFLFVLFISILLSQHSFAAILIGNGSPSQCTADSLQAALDQGGLIQFNCGGQHTIPLNQALIISQDAILDGGGNQQGGLITLDGQLKTRVLETNNSVTLEVKNLTIINGKPATDGGGAGLRIGNFSEVIVDNCIFTGNNGTAGAKEHGGGAIFIASLGKLSVHRSLFEENIGVNGGAINNLLSGLTVTDSRFINNDTTGGKIGSSSSANGYGGAIYTDGASDNNDNQGGEIRIEGCQFIGNRSAGQGGAVFSFVYPPDQVFIDRSLFMDNAVIKDNKSEALGGALRHGNGVLSLSNSSFINNTAQVQGGAVWIGERSQNSQIINSTFYRNQAVENEDGKGGLAGAIMPIGGSLLIHNCTIAHNHAGFVGGALFGGEDQVTLKNTIIAHNTAYNSGNSWNKNQNCAGNYRDGGHNLQFPAKNSQDATDKNCTTAIDIADPLLTDLIESTDFLPFLNLSTDSPAIDAGQQCEATDQRGVTRPVDGNQDGKTICDIGAIEWTMEITANNGMAYNSQQEVVMSTANFTPHIVTAAGELANASTIASSETVSLSITIEPDAQHVNLSAALLILAHYIDPQQQSHWFMRQGQQWIAWDGSPETLMNAVADLRLALSATEQVNIIENIAFQFAGQLQVLVGYAVQTEQENLIVFNGKNAVDFAFAVKNLKTG